MCDVTAAVVAVGAVAGAASSMSAKKGATSTSSSTQSLSPEQQVVVNRGYETAQNNLSAGQENVYSGAYTAAQNDTQKAAQGVLANYANTTGTDLARQVGSTASSMIGSAGSYADTAGALAANGAGPANTNAQGVLNSIAAGESGVPNANAGINPVANTAAATGYAGAANSIGNAGSMFAQSQQGSTVDNAATVSGAGQYINNDILNGQIDAASRDVTRNLSEDTLPGLNARAVAGGNLNSSRAGAAEAVARRGAADRIADTAATMRGQAYNTGITAAQTNQAQSNALGVAANAQLQNGAAIGANVVQNNTTQQQNDVENRLNAAKGAGALDTSNRGLDAETKLTANAQQGNVVAQGLGAATQAGALTNTNAGMLATAGDSMQEEEQRKLAEARAQVEAPQDRQAALLKDYWAVAGQNTGAGSSNGSSTSITPANPIGGALGGASLGMGLANGAMGTQTGAGLGALSTTLGMTNSNASAGALAAPDPNLLPARPQQGFGRYY